LALYEERVASERVESPKSDLVVVIFAGGAGQRMGGRKPLRSWRGARLIDRAAELARGFGGEVVIAVRGSAQIDHPPAPFVFDKADIEGPLAALEAGLEHAVTRGARRLLTIPCDAPLLPADLYTRLAAPMDGGARVVVAASGEHLHPDCALWDVAVVPALRAYHASGRSSLRGLAEAQDAVIVQWPSAAIDPFSNANTPEQLAALERLAASNPG
jgi:molybdopterin-guanine dinucleotide biosynthesis protein A